MPNNVLLVEDSRVGEQYKELLEKTLSVEVVLVTNKSAAIAAAEQYFFKVAILDQRLEPTNELGTDVFASLRTTNPALIGIMLSQNAGPMDVGDAWQRLDFFAYLSKTEILQLPDKVLQALHKFDVSVTLTTNTIFQRHLLYSYHNGLVFWRKYRVYLVSSTVLDPNYIFSDRWEEIVHLTAGETQEREISTVLKDTMEITSEYTNEIAFNYKVDMKTLQSSLSNAISGKASMVNSSKNIREEQRSFRLKRIYTLPSIPADSTRDYLASKKIEINQVYEKRLHIIEIVCPYCKSTNRYPLITYRPTSKVAKRQVDTYSISGTTIIDDGITQPN